MARYWFRQKHYGYGATPNTWQGWLLTLVSLALVLAMVVFDRSHPEKAWLATLFLFVMMVPLIVIIRNRTQGGWRWRWGDDD